MGPIYHGARRLSSDPNLGASQASGVLLDKYPMVKLPFCIYQLKSSGFVTHDSLGGSINIGKKLNLREGTAGYLKREATMTRIKPGK